MYPATEKEVIRNHISYICRKQHCVDSLVLYLNSPTRNDGTMLLWDRNNNGIVSVHLFSRSDGCEVQHVQTFSFVETMNTITIEHNKIFFQFIFSTGISKLFFFF